MGTQDKLEAWYAPSPARPEVARSLGTRGPNLGRADQGELTIEYPGNVVRWQAAKTLPLGEMPNPRM